MDNLIEFLTYMLVISALSEKVTQFFKTTFSRINKTAVITTISIITSGLFAYAIPPEGFAFFTKIGEIPTVIVIALLGSSGSGLWHDLLGIIANYKDSKKTT